MQLSESNLIACGAAAVGLVFVFRGYPLLRAAVRVFGVLEGLIVGAIAAHAAAQATQMEWVFWAIIPVCGLLGYLLSVPLYYVMIFSTAASAGPVLWEAVRGFAPAAPPTLTPLALGAILGVLGIAMERPLAIFATAVGGAFVTGASLVALDAIRPSHEPALLIGMGGLALLGMAAQARRGPAPQQEVKDSGN